MGSFNLHCSLSGSIISPKRKVVVLYEAEPGQLSPEILSGTYADYGNIDLEGDIASSTLKATLRRHFLAEDEDIDIEEADEDALLESVLEGSELHVPGLEGITRVFVLLDVVVAQCPSDVPLVDWIQRFGVKLQPAKYACQDYSNTSMRHWLLAQQCAGFPYAFKFEKDLVSVEDAPQVLAKLKEDVCSQVSERDCYWQSAGLQEDRLVAYFKLNRPLATLPEAVSEVKTALTSTVPVNWA